MSLREAADRPDSQQFFQLIDLLKQAGEQGRSMAVMLQRDTTDMAAILRAASHVANAQLRGGKELYQYYQKLAAKTGGTAPAMPDRAAPWHNF